MLMHSLSFLPVRLDDKWWLVSELGPAQFLNVGREKKFSRLGLTIAEAVMKGLVPVPIEDGQLLTTAIPVSNVLEFVRWVGCRTFRASPPRGGTSAG